MNLRRPPAFVLWGGRPELDVQIGSRRDRELQRALAAYARLAGQTEQLRRAFATIGVSARVAAERMTRAFRRAGTPLIDAAVSAHARQHGLTTDEARGELGLPPLER